MRLVLHRAGALGALGAPERNTKPPAAGAVFAYAHCQLSSRLRIEPGLCDTAENPLP